MNFVDLIISIVHRYETRPLILMPRTSTFTLMICRIAFIIVRNVLKFLLPIPFFPNTSIVLATLVGLNPLELKPLEFPTKFISQLPSPFHTVISKLRGRHDQLAHFNPNTTPDSTMDLVEKVRTWRQRQLAMARLSTARLEAFGDAPPPLPSPMRTRIDQVDFETPIQGMTRVIDESVGDVQQVISIERRLIVDAPLIPLSSFGDPI